MDIEKAYRAQIADTYLPMLHSILEYTRKGFTELCDYNDLQVTAEWLYAGEQLDIAEANFVACFRLTPWGQEEAGTERAIGWLKAVLAFLRSAYRSSMEAHQYMSAKIIEGGCMMKTFITRLEQEKEVLRKRRLIAMTPDKEEQEGQEEKETKPNSD